MLALATVLLEIRQAFHGSRLDGPRIFEAETYSYSAGILLISLGLLAGGLRWPKSDLRLAGFILLALTLGKAFLIDMDDLTGLLARRLVPRPRPVPDRRRLCLSEAAARRDGASCSVKLDQKHPSRRGLFGL